MKHFFVDYENVTDAGLQGCSKLKKEDKVTIYFSDNARKVDFRTLKSMLGKIKIELWEAESGYKNALDHQLATGLGFAIAENRDAEYYIVSSDNAFNAVATYWRKHNVFVKRVSNITEAVQEKNINIKKI